MGLILVPVIEKASEHITAMDEAYDNQMNFALSHVLGASIQTALLNTPLVVLVGWGLDKNMSLNFEMFDAIVLILAVIVVGNFLRDEKSDYLEGALRNRQWWWRRSASGKNDEMVNQHVRKNLPASGVRGASKTCDAHMDPAIGIYCFFLGK
jgi:hypothetical protein